MLLESIIKIGKLSKPFRTETVDMGSSGSKRLHIRDLSSGIIYLIDTGFDISLFPADSAILKKPPSDLVLYAATDSRVCTFGERILESFPELTSLKQGSVTTNVNVHHHILTNGPPVHDRARRLPPEKLAVAKSIFKQMVEDGFCQPSSSPLAKPLFT